MVYLSLSKIEFCHSIDPFFYLVQLFTSFHFFSLSLSLFNLFLSINLSFLSQFLFKIKIGKIT